MACDWICRCQGALDVILVLSIPLYCLVLYALVKKSVFSHTFTLLNVSLGVMDLGYAISTRLITTVPERNWLGYARTHQRTRTYAIP